MCATPLPEIKILVVPFTWKNGVGMIYFLVSQLPFPKLGYDNQILNEMSGYHILALSCFMTT